MFRIQGARQNKWTFDTALRVGIVGLYCVAFASVAQSALIAEYDFQRSSGNVRPYRGIIADLALPSPNHYMAIRENGASITSATIFGRSFAARSLGVAGRMNEPIEPTNQIAEYGFGVNKSLLHSLPEWTVLFWVNRSDAENVDVMFFVGGGEGLGGTGVATYAYIDELGRAALHNWSMSSVLDADLVSGPLSVRTWHQIGIARQGNALELFVDGKSVGRDDSANLTSFAHPSFTQIVFGAAQWMPSPQMRERVFDGLVDQVEVYDTALSPAEFQLRYLTYAVPEPSGLVAALMLLSALRVRR